MSKNIVRSRGESSGPLEQPVEMGREAWSLADIVAEDRLLFPLLARRYRDEYEDSKFPPNELATLQWEIGELTRFLHNLGPDHAFPLGVSARRALDFLGRFAGLVERAHAGGDRIIGWAE